MQGAWLFNVHTDGSHPMLEATVAARDRAKDNHGKDDVFAIGVTVLTSIGDAEYLAMNTEFCPRLSYEQLKPLFGRREDEDEERHRQNVLGELVYESGYRYLVKEVDNGIYRVNVVAQAVHNRTQMCIDTGMDGIVCSVADLPDLAWTPPGLKKVTPGIKSPIKGIKNAVGDDQIRIATPGFGAKHGSTTEVVGRAITSGETPEDRIARAIAVLDDVVPYV